MALDHLQPEGMHRPAGYTHVVTTSGRLVFLAGQVALDEAGEVVGPGDLEVQARQVFANIRTALAAVGATPAHIAKMTTYMVGLDADKRAGLAAARGDFSPDPPPASTLLGVQSLARPEFLIEIDVVAALD